MSYEELEERVQKLENEMPNKLTLFGLVGYILAFAVGAWVINHFNFL